jgi:hypothetical protein
MPHARFFSSNHYNTLKYDISYAISKSLTGPYTKVRAPHAPLLVSGKCGTTRPGGITVINVLGGSPHFYSAVTGF